NARKKNQGARVEGTTLQQPGQTPEMDVIVRYDINDYKVKTELTQQKLFTTMVTALRGYQDISTLEASRTLKNFALDVLSSELNSESSPWRSLFAIFLSRHQLYHTIKI
ncbi:MAG: hypothetical protein WCP20_15205, partial [Desulfuromonadales bacterium]